MAEKKKRNNTIDLLRGIFALIIVLYHSNGLMWGEKTRICQSGYIGVEFFFLVSGWLMAAHIRNHKHENTDGVGREAFSYVFGKAKKIYPFYFVSFVIAFIIRHVAIYLAAYDSLHLANHLLHALPELALLQMSGLQWIFPVNGIAWFLSAMLLAELLLYPVVSKHYDEVSHVYGPIAALLMLACLSQKYQTLNVSTSYYEDGWYIYLYIQPGLIRAAAEVLLGVSSFAICEKLSEIEFRAWAKKLFSVAECGCFLAVIAGAHLVKGDQTGFVLLAILFVGVTISFSQISSIAEKLSLHNGRMIADASMVVFLNQRYWLYLIPELGLSGYWQKLGVFLLLVACSSVFSYRVGNMLAAGMKRVSCRMTTEN